MTLEKDEFGRIEMNTNLTDATATRDRDRKSVLVIVLVSMLMAILDAFMMNIALPTVTTDFAIGIAEAQWVLTGYLIAMTSLFIIFGRLSEFTGKTRLFTAGLVLFTASSLACAIAPGISWLVASRILQGLGASMMFSISGAIIVNTFPKEEMGRAMGLFGAVFGLGAVLGPVLGGFLTALFGWQSIFLVNVPVGILLLFGVSRYFRIPETIDPHFIMDWIGACLLFVFITSLIVFCGQMAYLFTMTLLLLANGIVVVASFMLLLVHLRRCPHPIFDITFLKNRWFVMPVIASALFTIAVTIVNTIGPFYFQGVMGYSPLQIGLLYMLVPLFLMVASPVSGWVYDRYRYRYLAAVGVAISIAGFLILTYAILVAGLGLIVTAFVIRGIGGGFFVSPNATETMTSLPLKNTAAASSVSATMNNLASALGISLASILVAAGFLGSGYRGPVLGADQALLSQIFGVSALIAAGICLCSGIVSVMRNMQTPPQPTTAGPVNVYEE
ncbi:MFS transporter [Methanoregula sp.]|uniref:MFS transporter n=1 Tax=Methanoregula sp. TaxID=2052170 RepID=UPI003569C923